MYEAGLRGRDKVKDAEKVLRKRPILVLFFMDGCPHCESMQSAWKGVKGKMRGRATVKEIEASAVPDSEAVGGFPTVKYVSSGGTVKTLAGSRETPEEIVRELGLKNTVGARRNGTKRLGRHVSLRKLRHRTLRNHVSL